MQAGSVIADRFELQRVVGSGGMGTVYQALDRASGEHVAVKALLREGNSTVVRFEREALALMGLSHPGIVRYVTHGVTASQEPYLAVEWLEGEDLAQRLARRRLEFGESLRLLRRVAEALSVVHEHGIVHRDLKPSNLFLVDGEVDKVKLLDFGIARVDGLSRMTRTGSTLGTPGYMAPEQASGTPNIDSRADVFALGCVLYECLSGAPPFAGEHALAVLVKVLFEDVPRLSELCSVPEGVDELCAQMLAKQQDQRPRDAAEVCAALARLEHDTAEDHARSGARPVTASLTAAERRLVSVIVMSGLEGPRSKTLADSTMLDSDRSFMSEFQEIAAARGGRVEQIVDGSLVMTMTGSPVASDLASQAARCALALRNAAPRPIALSTGSCEVRGRLPIGEIIDRAVALLPDPGGELDSGDQRSSIMVDEVTAGLLDTKFELQASGHGLELLGERRRNGGGRTLLGRPTSLVGRELECSMLNAALTNVVEESTAHAAIVTAPSGIGKSRLAQEFIRAAKARDADLEIWFARGDSLRAGSAFNMIGQVVRDACGIQEGEPFDARKQRLLERVARHVPVDERERVAVFLGELINISFPDERCPMLQGARQDPVTMGEQIQRAWEDFLAAECEAHPVLVVLDDLHWGDLPTVRFIDSALGRLCDRPWMVLALGRPELLESFPGLWRDRRTLEIRLRPLTARASEKLVRQALGQSLGADTIEELVELADGHPFFLEELVRAVHQGMKDRLPDTVVATVQARLEQLEDRARRALRAASIFGDVFWRGAIAHLAGGAVDLATLDQLLASLERQELITRQPRSRFADEQQFAFRHSFVREGAYAMLTEDDRALGHRLAAQWLEASGEDDPLALAEQFERGGDTARAGGLYFRASQLALRVGDTQGATQRIERGLACGVSQEVKLNLLGTLCEAYTWAQIYTGAEEYVEEVRAEARPGEACWTNALKYKCLVDLVRGDIGSCKAGIESIRVAEPSPSPEALGAYAHALAMFVFMMDVAGDPDCADALVARLRETIDASDAAGSIARGWSDVTSTFHAPWIDEDPHEGLLRADTSSTNFAAGGVRRGVLMAKLFRGMNLWLLGDFERAIEVLGAKEMADEEQGLAVALRSFYLIHALLDADRATEARAEAELMLANLQTRGTAPDEGRAHWALAEVLRRQGELEQAEAELAVALEFLAPYALDHAAAHATLAALRLAQGRHAEAIEPAEHAARRYEQMRSWGFQGSFVSLVLASTLSSNGKTERASEVLLAARARVLAAADKIADSELRSSYLRRVPTNARVLELTSD